MAKDSYWFRHDSTAGRGTKMRKMAFIYGHWGKGVYWDVIEILRDQKNYRFDSDDHSLSLLADLIGCKDEIKFKNWYKDCVKLDLFEEREKYFSSPVLCENMQNWEIKKRNGSQGGRGKEKAKQKLNESESKANEKLNETIREEKSIEYNSTVDKKRKEKIYIPPTLEEVFSYFKENGYRPEAAKKFFDYYSTGDWSDSKGKKVKNWKQKAQGVWFKDENKLPINPYKNDLKVGMF